MNEIKCPHDLNQFLLGEPLFENPFPEEECEQRKFYGDCYHCFSTAIASRDRKLKNVLDKIRAEIEGLTRYWCEVNPRTVILDEVLNIIDECKEESEE